MLTQWVLIFLLAIIVFVEAQNLTLLSTEECGKTYGCWYFPRNCEADKCHGILKWQKLNPKHYQIEMQAKDLASFENGRYMAFGFSEDRYMGDDVVLECVIDSNGETGQAYISYNDGPTNFQLLDSSQKLLKNKQTLLKDGKMVCTFELDLNEKENVKKDEQPMIYDLESYWTLLFASGLTNPDTGEKIIHSLDANDEFYPWSTKLPVSLKENKVMRKMGKHPI